jgi:hypothetical protein
MLSRPRGAKRSDRKMARAILDRDERRDDGLLRRARLSFGEALKIHA